MMAFFGALYLLPIGWSIAVRDGMLGDFLVAAAINLVAGLGLAAACRGGRRELKPRDGFLLVTLAWTLMSASATIPLLTAIDGLSFTDAYFETVSGLTTTGATVLTGLEHLPPSINLWRHALHFFGGLGIIVLAVAILPLLGVGGMQLYRAESTGPVKDEKLTPRITGTAKSLWMAYLILTAAGILALKLCGLSWLDAVCHAFSAMSLGGFSTYDSSVTVFDSVAVEAVLIVLMLAASLNFARHFVAFRRLSVRPYLSDPEAKAIFLLLTASVIAIALVLAWHGTYASFATALRHSAFNVVSIASTTGFVSQNYETWPIFAPVWMLFLSCIVCSTGSTGGGIKMFRTLLLARQAFREMRLLVHPSAMVPVRIGGNVIPERIAFSVLGFIFLYFMTVVVLTFLLLLTGMDLVSAFTAIIACINNMGPGLGAAGPASNYQGFTDVQTWLCTVAMLLGRLEIFTVLVLFTPTFWRK